jgi:hypothetical protein
MDLDESSASTRNRAGHHHRLHRRHRADASGFGILKTDAKGRITEFMEKPGPTKDISDWIIPDGARTPAATGGRDYLARWASTSSTPPR